MHVSLILFTKNYFFRDCTMIPCSIFSDFVISSHPCIVCVNPKRYISLSLFHHDLYLSLQFALNTWRRSVPGLWLKPIQSKELARSHSSISLVNCDDYPPLIRRSFFLTRAFRFETAITVERASEHIKFIISRTRVAGSRNFVTKNDKKEQRKKEKAILQKK